MGLYCIKISPCFKRSALRELAKVDADIKQVKDVSDDTIMLESTLAQNEFLSILLRNNPVFIKHIAPTNFLCTVIGDVNIDKKEILRGLLNNGIDISNSQPFAIQTRIYSGNIDGVPLEYSSKDIEVFVGMYFEAAGGIPIFSERKIINSSNVNIISLLIHDNNVYYGFSTCEENLNFNCDEHRVSSKAGGRIISRAENKLLEALTKFNINLPGGIALDIGSAPGGWTNVLVERGYTVYAVDPANLHPSLMNDPRIKHYKCRAEQLTFENHFDIIVDDMNMDTDLTAQIMVDLSRCLKTGAFVIVTFKLPGHPDHGIEKGLKILTKEYEVIGVKSLFHNRQEVTVVARKE